MPVFVDGYEIDAAFSEDHTLDADVTEYPVERRFKNENFRAKPRQYLLEGVVSNSPFGPLADRRNQLEVINGESFALPMDEALAKLEDIHSKGEPVTVQTTLKTYTNMVLKTISIPRSIREGKALRFIATFIQIEIATNERSTVIVAVPRVSKKTSRGHLSTIKGPTIDEVAKSRGMTSQELVDEMFPHGRVKVEQ